MRPVSRSSTRKRVRFRCSDTYRCGKRFTLKRMPVESPRCPVCGGKTYCDEQNRRNEMAKAERCHCAHIPFPHKKGEIRWCEHHSSFSEAMTDEDYEKYLAFLDTPRSEWV